MPSSVHRANALPRTGSGPNFSPNSGISFSQRLHHVLEQLNVPVAPGPAAEAYTLRYANEPNIYVMSAAAGSMLLAAREAGVLPPAPPAAMLSALLALNHQPSGDVDATVGLDPASRTVVLSSRMPLTALDATLLGAVLATIRHKTTVVQGLLAGTSMPAAHRPAPHSWRR